MPVTEAGFEERAVDGRPPLRDWPGYERGYGTVRDLKPGSTS
jgi:hypothetical protein